MNKIRIYRTTDILAVRTLDATLWVPSVQDTFTRMDLWLAKDSTGILVGYASLKLVDGGSTAFLSKSGVLWNARGQGLQKRFIRVRERRARELGLSTIITYTSSDNVPSINSLISCGYKNYQPARDWGLPFGNGGLYWKKKL